jgi:hypothetical protein
MKLDHDALSKLVVQVNGAIALVSWPFALYESLSKKAGTTELKSKLDFKRDQLLNRLTIRVEETLLPFWPRGASRIVLDPSYEADSPLALSEAARDAVTKCLSDCEHLYAGVIHINVLMRRICWFDRAVYWLIFLIAAMALCSLGCWFFMPEMSDCQAKTAIIAPAMVVVIALAAAGIRQGYIQSAEKEIIEDRTGS